MRKQISIATCIALSFGFSAFAGGKTDSNSIARLQYNDYNYIHNIEQGSLNPTSTWQLAISELASLNVGYQHREGEFHRLDRSGFENAYGVDVYGIKRLKRTVFEGGVGYYNEDSRARCWNTTLYQNELNPFVLADAEPSNYNTERFRVVGSMAYAISPSLRFGVSTDYNVGTMSDEKDPRVETKGMRFILNPGVQWDVTSRLALGATGGVNAFSESSRYTCVATAVNFKFYLMSGLGTFFPESGTSYQRDTQGVSWFAAADAKYRLSNSAADFLSISYAHDVESAMDGGSQYQFKGGEFNDNRIQIRNRFSYKTSSAAHNLELGASLHNVSGRWYEQKKVIEGGTMHYVVMASSIKHKEARTELNARYRYDLLDSYGASTLTLGLDGGFLSSDTKNYPEMYLQKYSNFNVSGNAMKRFGVGNVRFGVGADAGYIGNLSASNNFSGLALAQQYSLPMYAYFTSSSVTANAKIEVSMPVGETAIQIYARGGAEQCLASKVADSPLIGKNIMNLQGGVTLYF